MRVSELQPDSLDCRNIRNTKLNLTVAMKPAATKYRYYGQFETPVDQFLHERYFAHDPRGLTILECGAFDGVTESSGKFFEETLGWQAINVEPSPRIFKQLSANRPNSINLNVALAEKIGEQEFLDVDHPSFALCTNGSLEHGEEHHRMLVEMGCKFAPTKVATTTLAALLDGLDFSEIELMVLDVEGYEVKALEGFRNARTLPRVLCVEHGHLGKDFLRPIIEPLGYRYDTESFVNSFYVRA